MTPTQAQLEGWGRSLREIDPESLMGDDDGAKVRWFLGDNGTELYVWSFPPKPAHHLQLVFARVSVEWSREKGLSTGTFSSGSTSTGGRYDPYLLSVGTSVDPHVCAAALVVLGASKVPAELWADLGAALKAASPSGP